ncbi:MAG TPA: globin domain-containing protein [Micromonosporaceae bacterium]
MWPGDQRRHHVDIEAYDQWLAWEHGLRLRRGVGGGVPEPRPGGTDEPDWGDQATLDASLSVVAPVAHELVALFYDKLFADNPRLRALFPENMDEQRDRLLAALLGLVQATDRVDLRERLEQLGRDHRKYGTRPAHYASVGRALIGALSHYAGPEWTPDVERAWLARYRAAVRIMLDAANADDQPPYWFATVTGHRRVGADMAILHVRPRHPYPYLAGQHATLVSQRLPRVWRPYAMATAAPVEGQLEFHVRALGRGGLSDVLVHSTAVGDIVRLGPPQGPAVLRAAGGRTRLFVASGTGWAPIKALLQLLGDSESASASGTVVVHMGQGGAPYDPDWAWLPDRHPWLTATVARSHGEVLERLPETAHPDWLDAYIGGPPDLTDGVCNRLVAAGVVPARIRSTSWPGA